MTSPVQARTEPDPTAPPQRAGSAPASVSTAERDRVVDLVRALALVTVVIGHWMMAVVAWGPGGIHGDNLLALAPWARWVTWVAQPMVVFFVAGGVANAAGWGRAHDRGQAAASWIAGRLDRLVRPTRPLVAAWTAGLAGAWLLGVGPQALATPARLVAMPLWFLAAYVGVVVATPAAVAAHRRWGAAVPVALVAGAALVDIASRALGMTPLGWANEALVWLAAHQMGLCWRDGRLEQRHGPALAAGGLASLVMLTQVFGYPVSMVGGAGEASNMTPPNLAIVALGAFQLGLVLIARDRLANWLERPRVWAAVAVTGALGMTTYLWHLTVFCAVVAIALSPLAGGWFPQPEPLSAAWWALRPAWIGLLVAATVPVVLWVARAEARRDRGRPAPVARPDGTARWVPVAGIVAAAGFTGLALEGFWVPGRAAAGLAGAVAVVAAPSLARLGLLRRLTP